MRKHFVLGSAIVLATVAYPFIVYFGLQHLGVPALALILFSLLLLRLLLSGTYSQAEYLVPLLLVGSLCLVAAWLDNDALLRVYPVLMNLVFAIFFWLSLNSTKPLIERMVSPFMPEISVPAKRYMRGLTKIWALLLLLNAGVALYTACCLSMRQWALYNGVIAYLIFGVFTLFELIYRQHYKKQHGE